MDYNTRNFEFKAKPRRYDILSFDRTFMSILRSLMIKLGLADLSADRTPISVMLLDDDERRHRWFDKRFVGDELDIAVNVEEAKELLADRRYDAIFLDHDLL